MSFLNFLFGSGEKTQQFQRYTPQQQNAFSQLLGGAQKQLPQGLEFLSQLLTPQGGDEEMYQRPAMRQFYEDIVPGIAERFTGTFGPGSQRSSAFGQQLGQQGAALAERLAAGKFGRQQSQQQMGLAGLGQLQNLLGAGLTPQFDYRINQGSPGVVGQFAGGLGQGLPQLLKLLGGMK